jgi:hypothetical protein
MDIRSPRYFIETARLSSFTQAAKTLDWQVAHAWNGRYLPHAARAWLEVCGAVLGDGTKNARGSPHPR